MQATRDLRPWSRFRNTDTSGRTTGLLLRCVLYSLLALGLIIVDKRYDHLGRIRRAALGRGLSRADRGRESVRGLGLVSRERHHPRRAARRQGQARRRTAHGAVSPAALRGAGGRKPAPARAARQHRGSHRPLRHRRCHGCGSGCLSRARAGGQGRADGVFVGQAVLDAGGVFGQVARVGQLTSEVILVSDATHAIPVQVNRNGLRTMAVGTGDTEPAQAAVPAHQRRCGRRAICW